MMLVWSLITAIVLLVLLVGWLLRPDRVRGGQLDLTAAAARGELDLRWDWPSAVGRVEPVENGDDLSAPTTWAA